MPPSGRRTTGEGRKEEEWPVWLMPAPSNALPHFTPPRLLVVEDYDTHVAPLVPELAALVAAAGPRAPSDAAARSRLGLPSFRAAASWVASRSFGVDSALGRSMVPFADAFNHKAAVVDVGGGAYAVERVCFDSDDSGGDSGSEEGGDGSEGGDSSGEEDGGSEEDGEQASSSSDGGGAPPPPVVASPRSDGLALELAICGGSRGGREVLEVYAASAVAKGHEAGGAWWVGTQD